MTNPSIDIVMVAYRSEADLPDVMEGLRTMSALPHTLHLHDNIGNTKTLTRAWSELAERGHSDYIAFLNTDIRLSPDWDARLVAGLDKHADAGVVMPKAVGSEWRSLLDPAQPSYPDPATAPAPTHDAMRRLSGLWVDRSDDYSFGGCCNAAFYAVMMRRSVWESLRGFDERYRFYGQDHDFQRRLFHRFGKYAILIASAPVWHRCGGSVRKAAERGEVNFSAEMNHCGEVDAALAAGQMKEWDLLSEVERAAIRLSLKYSRMPTH